MTSALMAPPGAVMVGTSFLSGLFGPLADTFFPGTTLARRLLEAMTDAQFCVWANRLITSVALYGAAQGMCLLAAPRLFATAAAKWATLSCIPGRIC